MVIVRVSMSVSAPPVPVLPPSSVVMVKVTAPLASGAGVNTGAEAPRNVLMLANVPVSVSVPVLEPLTITPPPLTAVSLPEPTSSVTVIEPAAASTSDTDRPVRVTAVSSLVV